MPKPKQLSRSNSRSQSEHLPTRNQRTTHTRHAHAPQYVYAETPDRRDGPLTFINTAFPSPFSWRPVALSTSKPSPRFSNLCQDAWLPASVSPHPGRVSGPLLPLRYDLPACLLGSPPRSLLVAAKTPEPVGVFSPACHLMAHGALGKQLPCVFGVSSRKKCPQSMRRFTQAWLRSGPPLPYLSHPPECRTIFSSPST